MGNAIHATEYLRAPGKHAPGPVCALFGDEAFLKRQVFARLREEVLGGGDGELSLSTLDGPTALLRDVLDELSTRAMFGGGNRLVHVAEADEFVTRYRPELEDYVARPIAKSVLVLEVKSWPANTRLAKAVAAAGLAIECNAPSPALLAKWLLSWAKQQHGADLTPAAAELLVEMIGPEMGLLDQDLAKLALAVQSGGKITPQMVSQAVGTWRAKTAWDMLDAALAGNAREALVELDRLLLAGEHPVAILAQVGSTLRRFAAATRVILDGEAAGRRVLLRRALEQAGVKPYFLDKSERQLRQLGRHRGARLYSWLLEADLDLKGDSPLPPRMILERLIVRIASPGLRQPT